ncbi:MAG: GntR family transcriptional regulator [Pseudomonadales bacterium]
MPNSSVIVPIREQIANKIRAEIFNGELAENTKLKEQILAERFGVSRGPIRDVFIQLTKEGLLVSKNNCGVAVNSALTPALQKLMIKLRIDVETFAMRECSNTLDDTDFAHLEDILSALGKAFDDQDYARVTQLDMQFHRYLVRKSGGDELVNIWQPIIFRMRMNYKRISAAKECIAEHRAILNGLKSGDSKIAIAALKGNIR